MEKLTVDDDSEYRVSSVKSGTKTPRFNVLGSKKKHISFTIPRPWFYLSRSLVELPPQLGAEV